MMKRTLKNSGSWRSFNKMPRVYCTPTNETVVENFFNRHNRPAKEYKKVAIDALKTLGIQATKMRWSQYAGCTCPCSPGFILDDFTVEPGVLDTYRFDVFVDVEN
jgi:hypothetical protein